MELASIQRLLPLCHNTELTGVSVIPLKVKKRIIDGMEDQ